MTVWNFCSARPSGLETDDAGWLLNENFLWKVAKVWPMNWTETIGKALWLMMNYSKLLVLPTELNWSELLNLLMTQYKYPQSKCMQKADETIATTLNALMTLSTTNTRRNNEFCHQQMNNILLFSISDIIFENKWQMNAMCIKHSFAWEASAFGGWQGI